MIHDVKLSPDWFLAIKSGVTVLELPLPENTVYKPNDTLLLHEHDGEKYTGNKLAVDVRFTLRQEKCRDGHTVVNVICRSCI